MICVMQAPVDTLNIRSPPMRNPEASVFVDGSLPVRFPRNLENSTLLLANTSALCWCIPMLKPRHTNSQQATASSNQQLCRDLLHFGPPFPTCKKFFTVNENEK